MKSNILKNRILVVLAVFASVVINTAGVSAAGEKEPLTLSLADALAMARERHIDVIVADERVNQAVARIGQARSALLPQLTGVVSDKEQTSDLRSTGSIVPVGPRIGPFNSYDARIKLTQEIFDLASLERLKAARDSRQLSLIESEKTRQDVLALVAVIFITAKRAEEKSQATQALLDRDEEAFKVTEAKYKNGTGSLLDFKKAKANRAKSAHARRAAAADSLERRLDLAAALGIPSDQTTRFAEEADFSGQVFPTQEEAVKNLNDQPDVKTARQKLNVRKSELAAERSEYLPKISGVADYGRSGEDPNNSGNVYSFGLQASIPIFEGGLRQSRIQEAVSQVKESEEVLKNTERLSEAKILNAMESIKAAETFLEQKSAEKDFAAQGYDLAEARFHSGMGSGLDLAGASAQRTFSDDEFKEAKANYLLAQINLAHALGKVDQLFINGTGKGDQSEK